MPTRRTAVLTLLVLFALPGVLRADPPGRAARLGYFSGSISFRPASLDDWSPISANYPLTTGDHIWADDGARGEIRVGRSTVVRLGPRTAFSFLNLDDATAQMRVSEGSLAVTVNRLDEDEVVEVDTPNAAVSILRPGFYRVAVDGESYETTVIVRQGEAEVVAGGAAVPVYSRDAIVVSGDDAYPRYDIRDASGPDAWEEWALERDRREERLESRRYVSDAMVGYEDLDDHGRWRDDPEYGHVWSPTHVAVDWAPYRYGRWAWVPPWGWTWIDDSPWGFAPFHYGRWARRPWGWCWVPGTIVARPVYAPALVAFVGGDDWFASISFGGGGGVGIGWFPLGPSEVYYPPYQVSPGYIRNVNVTNVTNVNQINVTNINVTNVYVNQTVPGAVTAVNTETFVRGQKIEKAAVAVPAHNLQRARVRQVRPAVVDSLKPRRESVVGDAPAARAAVAKPPARVQDRAVVTRVAPPQAAPRAVEGVKPAPAPKALAKAAAQEGKADNFRPAREGLRAPRAVRSGERPRPKALVKDGARERPPVASPPATEQQRERSRETDRDRERAREKPPTDRPEAAKPPADERQRDRERAPAVSPSPAEDQRRDPAKDREKERDQRDRAREKPPTDRPEAAKPPADERQRDRERPPAATPPPAAEQQRDRRPEASKPPTDERTREREKEREKEKEKEKAKPTPKPKAKPTPTPTPEDD